MVERYRPTAAALTPSVSERTNLFLERKEITFLPSGCTLLDCIMGGGWPLGRVVNIVGDKSTGKTLLAEEAMANFHIKYPRGKVYYRETEAAFDESYFKALGGSPEKVDFGPDGVDTHWQTVEAIQNDLGMILDKYDAEVAEKAKVLREKNKRKKTYTAKMALDAARETMLPALYIVDSLDALSSEAELSRAVKRRKAFAKGSQEELSGTYNLEKPKIMGEFFREEIKRIKRSKICIMIISQIRDRIGAMIRGVKYTRTGGRALDFYASIVLYLAEIGKVPETIKGIKRVVAIKVKAKATKNKITVPHRECEFEIRFGWGVDDEYASLDFLKTVNKLSAIGLKEYPKSLKDIDKDLLRKKTIQVWREIEEGFAPPKGKYAA
jgi:recombination protein RecA